MMRFLAIIPLSFAFLGGSISAMWWGDFAHDTDEHIAARCMALGFALCASCLTLGFLAVAIAVAIGAIS